MPSPDLERFAAIIADDVVSARERERDGGQFHPHAVRPPCPCSRDLLAVIAVPAERKNGVRQHERMSRTATQVSRVLARSGRG